MIAVRYLALTALVVWVGGMMVLALVVAPATFRVLDAAAAAGGASLAGPVVGDILQRFNGLAYTSGGVLLVCLFVMKFVGPPPRAFTIRAAIVAAMLAVTAYSGFPLAADITRLQSQVGGSESASRARLDQLHRTSTALMTLNTCLGLVLLFWYVKE